MRWPFTRAYEVATLGRDAARVCEDAERRFRPEEVRALAAALRGRLEDARRRLGQPRTSHDNVLYELRGRHREARRRRRDRELSELTLAIIRLRAEKLGADEAARTIDRFLERWPAAGADGAEAEGAADPAAGARRETRAGRR